MAFLIIFLLLALVIVAAPWLGADSRKLERRSGDLPDWPAYPSSSRPDPIRRIR